MDNIKVGNFLYQLRKEKHYTQEEVAKLINVSSKTISKWELGDGYPSIQYLIPLSKIYDVSVEEILNGERNIKEITTTNKINSNLTSIIASFILIISLVLYFVCNLALTNSVAAVIINISFSLVALLIYILGNIYLEKNNNKYTKSTFYLLLISNLIQLSSLLAYVDYISDYIGLGIEPTMITTILILSLAIIPVICLIVDKIKNKETLNKYNYLSISLFLLTNGLIAGYIMLNIGSINVDITPLTHSVNQNSDAIYYLGISAIAVMSLLAIIKIFIKKFDYIFLALALIINVALTITIIQLDKISLELLILSFTSLIVLVTNLIFNFINKNKQKGLN